MRLEVEELARTYGSVHALAEVELRVSSGERVGVVGAEGAGKTTLARVLAGLEPATSGSMLVEGREATADASAFPRVGYVPSQPGLPAGRTPRELLRFTARLHGLSASRTERRLEQLLIDVRLEHLGGHAIEHLDVAKRRRLALANALVPAPACLVLDEPTRGLSPSGTRAFHDGLASLLEDEAVLLTTSDPAEAQRFCDRVVGLEDGRVVVDAPLEELLQERGTAVDVHLADALGRQALDALREHEAVGALRREPEDAGVDLELWVTEPALTHDVLAAMVEAGASVEAFAPRGAELADVLDELMEAPP